MKYKAGDKFIIEIEKTGKTIAKIKGFRTLVFDDYGLDKLEQVQEHDGCFGCKFLYAPKECYPCLDCMHNFLDRWERKTEEIRVGDEVELNGKKAVVVGMDEQILHTIRKRDMVADVTTLYWGKEYCTRTGKTYPELIKALEELPKEGE